MKKATLFFAIAVLFSFSHVHAADKATPEDVYNLVLKAYEVVSSLGEESFPAFNDPKGEFVYKDTYAYIQRCPNDMMAHPYALEKLKGIKLGEKFEFTSRVCKAAEQPGGGWTEYYWPRPGETEPSRKVTYGIKVEGTPYTIFSGIYSDTAIIEDLNKTLR